MIRVVDGKAHHGFFGNVWLSNLGPDNNAVTSGPHAHAFADRIGKTHFVGLRLPSSDIWKARGTFAWPRFEIFYSHSHL